jgi:hypothetical protein
MTTTFQNLLMAGTLGLTAAFFVFFALALFLARETLVRIWAKTSKRLSVALILGYAMIAMAAVTQTDLTTQVKNILPSANGGTGSAFFGISGPTALRTYALPDTSTTILTANTPVTVAQGGSGTASTLSGYVLGGSPMTAVAAVGTKCYPYQGSGGTGCDSGGSATNLYQETPSGTVNGSNVTFTLAHTPASPTNVNLFMNGVQQQQGAGNDYTISGATITYLTAPNSGAKLVALYF